MSPLSTLATDQSRACANLRHTCASLLIQPGALPTAIQDWLSHSHITVTMNLHGTCFRPSKSTWPTCSTRGERGSPGASPALEDMPSATLAGDVEVAHAPRLA